MLTRVTVLLIESLFTHVVFFSGTHVLAHNDHATKLGRLKRRERGAKERLFIVHVSQPWSTMSEEYKPINLFSLLI